MEPTWLESERFCRISQGRLLEVTFDFKDALEWILLQSGKYWSGLSPMQRYRYFGSTQTIEWMRLVDLRKLKLVLYSLADEHGEGELCERLLYMGPGPGLPFTMYWSTFCNHMRGLICVSERQPTTSLPAGSSSSKSQQF